MEISHRTTNLVPCVPCVGFDDSDEQKGESAQDHVGADPVFQVVVNRVQLECGLHVPLPTFYIEQLFVSLDDVLDAETVIRGAQQVFPVPTQPPG